MAVTTHIVPREMDTMVLLPAVLREEANGLLGIRSMIEGRPSATDTG